jgi:hypothetical protein
LRRIVLHINMIISMQIGAAEMKEHMT